MSQGIHGIAKPGLLASPFADTSRGRQSTPPPPMHSPMPRTPRPRRFLNPPKTPLHKLHASFGESDLPAELDLGVSNLEAGNDIERPDSACSSYSCSSSSSIDTQTTYTSVGGSCTSPEPDEDELERKGKEATAEGQTRKRRNTSRTRRVEWTDDMDAHLWRSYTAYQQDPKITPFIVLPGHSPPLGVCYKVAREAKRTWRSAALRGEVKTPTTPRLRRMVTPINGRPLINRGDSMRQATRYSWPASESSTRRRLRALCKHNYGPSHKPFNNHQQQRGAGDLGSRPSVKPSSLKPTAILPNNQDPFYTTRSMALSLTTSTSRSMRPNGVLASLAAGQDVMSGGTGYGGPEGFFGGIAERIQEGNSNSTTIGVSGTSTSVGVSGSDLLDLSFAFEQGEEVDIDSGKTSSTNDGRETPSLLPALELGSSATPYGTWPRRLKRPELQDDDDESADEVPPKSRPRRGTLCDLFGEGEVLPATIPMKTQARTRGHTISSGINPAATKKRPRPSAPLLTVTGPVSYESPSAGESPLANRVGDLSCMPPRLGSPFMENVVERREPKDDLETSGSEVESPCGKRARE